jgi:hypothetical protein
MKTLMPPKKPEEPNLLALREVYDKQAGLEEIEILQKMRDFTYEYVGKVIREMRLLIENLKLVQVNHMVYSKKWL